MLLRWINVGVSVLLLSLGLAPLTVAATEGYVLHARSAHVTSGKPYPFRLYTHCGANFAVDFDHSFWDLIDKHWRDRMSTGGREPHAGLDDPFQLGTMTLADRRHARFDFTQRIDSVLGTRFAQRHIHFTRHGGRKVVPIFCDKVFCNRAAVLRANGPEGL